MSVSSVPPLTWPKPVLKALWLLVFACGAGILGLIVFSFVAEARLIAYLGSLQSDLDGATLLVWMRVAAGIGLLMVPLFHIVLTRLLAIVDTVRLGDAFVPENAVRLKQAARAALGLQLLDLAFGVLASALSSGKAQIEWSFSVTSWILVVLLFVLASVFEQGARMRQDLEGTV